MDNDEDIACGPFVLLDPIDRGGMGAVYRARHRRSGTKAAVKILLPERARREQYKREFRAEIGALARLNHPAIATLYDYGFVDEQLAEAGPETFVENTPWLAMEYVDGESLVEAAGSWTWDRLESCVLALLDGLAHAHANDVIHRDLKPSNVLVPSGSQRPRLVDFGIAAVFDEARDEDADPDSGVRGTPEYMAPEQILGKTLDHSAPTDLYALGCMVWQIVCGEPPFTGEDSSDILDAHLFRIPEDFAPRFQIPSGVRTWLAGLLAKRPWTRYRRAADAAWALLRLTTTGGFDSAARTPGEATGDEDFPTLGTLHVPPSETPDATRAEQNPLGESVEPSVEYVADDSPVPKYTRPPIPDTWEREEHSDTEPLSAAGLELFGLRRLPVVDRRRERDILWESLLQVDRSGSPTCVLLAGPPGSGKSKLADWLVRRGEETGAATGLDATHSPARGPADGLASMVLRHFHLDPLQTEETEETAEPLAERLVRLEIDRSQAEVDAEAFCREAGGFDDTEERGFRSSRERHLAYRRFLGALADYRPVVLWLDDIPWGRRTARFVDFLMNEDHEMPLPVLVLMTARSNALRRHGEVRRRLDPLFEQGAGRRVEVDPLRPGDQREMITRMLQFTPEVVDELVERTEGYPLFAVQLVTDWVNRDLLVSTDEGFAFPAGGEAPIPADLRELWERRIDDILNQFPHGRRDDLQQSLELAALLGKRVDRREWEAAADLAGVEASEELVSTMTEAGLAQLAPEGWEFVHGLLVEALERRAEQNNRLEDHHRRCAIALDSTYPNRRRATAQRRALHWDRAGEPDRALAPMLLAIRQTARRRGYESSRALLERRRDILDELGLPEDDRHRIENRIERARQLAATGHSEGAVELLEAVGGTARGSGHRDLFGRAALSKGRIQTEIGRLGEAFGALTRAEEAFRETGDRAGIAEALLARGNHLQSNQQKFEHAEASLQSAHRIFAEADDDYRAGLTRVELVRNALFRGRLQRAAEGAEALLESEIARRHRLIRLHAEALLGEAERFRGYRNRARDRFRAARDGFLELQLSREAALQEKNLAELEIRDGRYSRAWRRLEGLEEEIPKPRRISLHLAHAACSAAGGNWAAWSRSLSEARDNLAGHGLRYVDQPAGATLAGEVAETQESPDRAREAYALARDLWNELGRERRVEQLEARLASLPPADPSRESG